MKKQVNKADQNHLKHLTNWHSKVKNLEYLIVLNHWVDIIIDILCTTKHVKDVEFAKKESFFIIIKWKEKLTEKPIYSFWRSTELIVLS